MRGRSWKRSPNLAWPQDRRRFFVNFFFARDAVRRGRYRCWSNICGRSGGLENISSAAVPGQPQRRSAGAFCASSPNRAALHVMANHSSIAPPPTVALQHNELARDNPSRALPTRFPLASRAACQIRDEDVDQEISECEPFWLSKGLRIAPGLSRQKFFFQRVAEARGPIAEILKFLFLGLQNLQSLIYHRIAIDHCRKL